MPLILAYALCVTGVAAGPMATASAATPPHPGTASTPGVPRFFNYASPAGTADNAGEPSIGINWTTERVFSNSNGSIPNGGTANYFGGFLPYMVKVTFDDCQSPAKATWEQKPLLTANTPRVFGDPILFTDHVTGRTFVTQLEGLTPAGSTTDITDNDGDSFSPSEGSGAPSCIDHETIGGGPFHAPLSGTTLYPNAIYYASQCVSDAVCALSLDGGRTFVASVPMFTVADCDGLHGHIKVAPDGTVYVPDKGCGGIVPLLNGGQPAAVVSENNGVTWNIRTVPDGTSPGEWDPSIGIATDGTVYLGYQALNGHAMIAVSHDRGLHWSASFDVGAQQGIQNIAFPAVVAGDPDRAAFAFYGTTTADGPGESHNGGASGDDPNSFTGIWYLFIATTFNGGQTWTTQNVTPGDPIQRGPICGGGTCRNMLDFFDASIDKEGRVLVGWDDGCIGGCVDGPPNSFTAKATITRQSGGKRMFAAYDPVEPALAQAPGASGILAGSAAELCTRTTFSQPVPITAYKVYRRIGTTNPFQLITTVSTTHYTDPVNPTDQLFYRVSAVSSLGEGPYCHDITLGSPPPTACVERGIKVIDDLNPDGTDADAGQNTPPDGSVNVKQLWLAEPYLGPGVNQLVFTLQVAPSLLSSPPPNSQWFIVWNALNPNANFDRRYVAMRTDATGATSFEYGKFGVALDPTNPNPNANTPVMLGAADQGSYSQATGVIRIVLSNSKAENIQAGQSLVGLNVRTYLNRPDPGQRSQNNASDITGNSNYTLVGNASCFCYVDRPPVAALAASPTSGQAPLTVNFDASGSSDPDVADGDAVASYTFNFGDGSNPVTQSSPTISHTYNAASGPSGYFVTLTCKDQKCGTQSLNVASTNIEVSSGTSGVPPADPVAFGLAPLSNPSRGQVFFDLGLDRDGTVSVQAFSAAGRRVANLIDAWMPAGRHTLHWRGLDGSGRPVAPGVYLFRAKAGGRVVTTRVVLLP